MNKETSCLLFALLRSALFGANISDEEKKRFSENILKEIIATSERHDIAHLISFAISQNNLLAKESGELDRHVMTAIYRYEQINYEYNRTCNSLEAANIPFIPLKGAVIRKYYPEPWMRTSCDIDILVHEDQVDSTSEYLVNKCGYTNKGKSSHDISLFTQGKNHIELHYDLVEDGLINNSSNVLRTVWETAVPHGDCRYWLDMPDEMFYFYHIAHMAKHFVNGGCGIRPFIDLWILDNIEEKDLNKRDELLRQGDLLRFAEVARLLSGVWFDGNKHNEITMQMENYILNGGVYGTQANRVAVQQQKKGGRLKYALSKIFIPYETLKFQYPILQKHRWLTPIMEVLRWFRIVFCGRAKSSIKELKMNNDITSDDAKRIQAFLDNIGL